MNEIFEYLPFIIPLAVAQFALMAYAVIHILTHSRYKRGSRPLWLVVSILVNFIGPILYILLGKDDQ